MAKIDYEEFAILAHDLRSKWSLSDAEPINCKSLLWKLNIHTAYRPLSESFSGMCLKSGETMFMMINSNNPRGRQHFTIAHEFYHLFVQKSFEPHLCNPGYISNKDINEQKADAFASEFLMPKIGILKMIPLQERESKTVSISTLLKLEQYFLVSHSALINRLKFLKHINQEQFDLYAGLRIKKTALEYGFAPDLYESGNNGLIISDYGSKAKELFSSVRISESHYYELMNAIGFDPTTNTNK